MSSSIKATFSRLTPRSIHTLLFCVRIVASFPRDETGNLLVLDVVGLTPRVSSRGNGATNLTQKVTLTSVTDTFYSFIHI